MEEEEESGPGVPEWVVTYGDMMSLLLTFFIMLVSISELKKEGELKALMQAIRATFGAEHGKMSVPGKADPLNSNQVRTTSQSSKSQNSTKKSARDSPGPIGEFRTVQSLNQATRVTLGGAAGFQRFDDQLNDAAKQTLDVLKSVLVHKPNRIIIRGHSSPEPLPPVSRFRDQMDLSYSRALAAADYLIQQGVSPQRIIVSAAGDTELRTLSRNKDDQRDNRRVDVFLIDAYIAHPEYTGDQ